VRQALERISTLSRDALEQVRALSYRLHPPEWQRLTIGEALRQLWELSGIPQSFDASLRIEPLPREPGLELKILTYRAAQEAFSNLAQHARPTRVEASLETRGGRLVLTIRDNGSGFDAAKLFAAPASLASGIGLRSIREQAAGLGGRIDIRSGPEGTTLELSAPYFRVQREIHE
jgi:signal transduction histidine kinase